MANYEATKYDFDGANLTGIEGIPTATIVPWSSASVPTGFLECAGAAVSRSTYSALFGIVGTTYGAGDGSSTFNLPNLADNVPIGKSPGKALASTGGANTVAVTAAGNVGGSTANATLSTAQLASHSHSYTTGPSGAVGQNTYNSWQVGGGGSVRAGSPQNPNTTNSGSGSGHSHNMSATFSGSAVNAAILQPYLTLIYIIKT
jgi:microcystin-dependent protein